MVETKRPYHLRHRLLSGTKNDIFLQFPLFNMGTLGDLKVRAILHWSNAMKKKKILSALG